jgi:hypothetical protein
MDEGKVELWPNAVAALGVYGEEEDLALLEAFAGRDDPPSEAVTAAKENVPSAIGFLSGKFASERGLTFLENATDVDAAAEFVEAGDAAVEAQLAQGFARSSLVALAQAEGEIARRADLGQGTEALAVLAQGAVERGMENLAADDAAFPGDPALAEEFRQMLNEVRARVREIGQEAYIRSGE